MTRLTAFAEEHSDIMTYYSEFAASGLQEEYTDIISKVAVSSMDGGGQSEVADAKELVEYARDKLNITLDDLFEEPGVSIWMLDAKNVDEYGKKKGVMNPDNLNRFRHILEDEILQDISLKEALMGGM